MAQPQAQSQTAGVAARAQDDGEDLLARINRREKEISARKAAEAERYRNSPEFKEEQQRKVAERQLLSQLSAQEWYSENQCATAKQYFKSQTVGALESPYVTTDQALQQYDFLLIEPYPLNGVLTLMAKTIVNYKRNPKSTLADIDEDRWMIKCILEGRASIQNRYYR